MSTALKPMLDRMDFGLASYVLEDISTFFQPLHAEPPFKHQVTEEGKVQTHRIKKHAASRVAGVTPRQTFHKGPFFSVKV